MVKRKPVKDNITLTPAQEDALDRAWATITDADIEASIRWIENPPPTTKKKGVSPNGR
jgi:hypothetical protein